MTTVIITYGVNPVILMVMHRRWTENRFHWILSRIVTSRNPWQFWVWLVISCSRERTWRLGRVSISAARTAYRPGKHLWRLTSFSPFHPWAFDPQIRFEAVGRRPKTCDRFRKSFESCMTAGTVGKTVSPIRKDHRDAAIWVQLPWRRLRNPLLYGKKGCKRFVEVATLCRNVDDRSGIMNFNSGTTAVPHMCLAAHRGLTSEFPLSTRYGGSSLNPIRVYAVTTSCYLVFITRKSSRSYSFSAVRDSRIPPWSQTFTRLIFLYHFWHIVQPGQNTCLLSKES